MLAHLALAGESKELSRSLRSVLLLLFGLIVSSATLTVTSVKPSKAAEAKESSAASIHINVTVNMAGVAVGDETVGRSARVEGTAKPDAGKILKEIGKQAIDQPGHLLIGGGPIWASRYLVGVPWYGWAVTPLLVYREWHQWPSKRWWDPPLDWAFLALGVVAATWSRRPRRRAMGALRSICGWAAGRLSSRWTRRADRAPDLGDGRAAKTPRAAHAARVQCSSRSRIPAMTSRIPTTSVRLGHSWNRRIEAAKVNTSSIWPSART